MMIRKYLDFSMLLTVLVLLSGCSNENKGVRKNLASIFQNEQLPVSPGEMKEYVVDMDNGLLKTKKIDEVLFSAKYKPVEYLIAMETEGEDLTKEVYNSKYEELKGLQYFDLRIEIEKSNGELLKYALRSGDEYEKRVNYLAFEIQNDIKLIDGDDTLDCIMHHFERVYDIVPFATVLLAFEDNGSDLMQQKTLIYHDRMFGKGIIKFTFMPADLQTIPQLEVIS